MNHKTPANPSFAVSGHALSIAGSDSCGGAGIQADIKTMAALGVEAGSVVTAITAQNTLGVHAVEVLGTKLVIAQLNAVLDDLPIRAVKTGMLANAAIIEALGARLSKQRDLTLVVDPVMVATSGARLLDQDAEAVLIRDVLPLAALVTPNLPEARALTACASDHPPEALAEKLLALGCRAVLLKGGHAQGDQVEDLLVSADGERRFRHPRVSGSVHGTGCVLSAAITALLARGLSMEDAVAGGIDWLHQRLPHCWQPSKGPLGMLPLAGGRKLDR